MSPGVFIVSIVLPGVVIVDDQPEVTVDDPAFIFETNDGFQEVMSKKAQKERQKALLEAEVKKQVQLKKEKDVSAAYLLIDITVCRVVSGWRIFVRKPKRRKIIARHTSTVVIANFLLA